MRMAKRWVVRPVRSMPRGSTNPRTVVRSSSPLLTGESARMALVRLVSGSKSTNTRLLIKIPLVLFFIALSRSVLFSIEKVVLCIY